MVQFLSIIFFLGFLQFLLGFSNVPFFCVTLYKEIKKINKRNDEIEEYKRSAGEKEVRSDLNN